MSDQGLADTSPLSIRRNCDRGQKRAKARVLRVAQPREQNCPNDLARIFGDETPQIAGGAGGEQIAGQRIEDAAFLITFRRTKDCAEKRGELVGVGRGELRERESLGLGYVTYQA